MLELEVKESYYYEKLKDFWALWEILGSEKASFLLKVEGLLFSKKGRYCYCVIEY